MSISSVSEFFNMGGYALYVWTSYSLALIVLIVNLIVPIQHRKKIDRMLARKLRREGEAQ